MARRTGDPYFDWLCIRIGVNPRIPKRNYGTLASMLHGINYIPMMEMDGNRANDGIQLRVEFMNIHGPYGSSTNRGPCTMLEFMTALAMKMNFLMGEEDNPRHTEWYFRRLLKNLGLQMCTDDVWDERCETLTEGAVERVLGRRYARNGEGGLFPLRGPCEDQRRLETEQQMHRWLMENSDIDLLLNEEPYADLM